MKATLEAMPAEVRDLARPWRSLVGAVPLLTPELEQEFRFGQRVIYFNGQYRFGGNIKGGSSSIWAPATCEQYECYTRWRDLDGIPEEEDPTAFERLLSFLADRGVTLLNGNYPPFQQERHRYVPKLGWVYRTTHELFSRLPSHHFGDAKLSQIHLGGWGPDSAKASAYDAGVLMMYDFALEGARRTYWGLVLHEMGHAHMSLFAPAALGALGRCFETIRRRDSVLGVEYLLDAETRRIYQLRFFEEFLAELYLIYASQGARLREHIEATEGALREAWGEVYSTFAGSFQGAEYL